ncbi:sodium/bile acid cotransporter-like [Homarus americanus]|uniref:sodium/bile acid cotransporter-like n=1 Tax=Homarus americanus TaxID=6706 RepID=UPI001C48D931|nr:sodium/bile acid cotransporter-like [Homarus americanus]
MARMLVFVSQYCWGHYQSCLLLVLSLALTAGAVTAQYTQEEEDRGVGVVVEPQELHHVVEGTDHVLTWYSNQTSVVRVDAFVSDEMVGTVTWASAVSRGEPNDNYIFTGNLNVSALFIGYNKIKLSLYDDHNVMVGEVTVKMTVLLSYQNLSDLFTVLLGILIAILYAIMGVTMDLSVVKTIMMKPIGPIIGMICQYIIMPLLGFGLGMLAFPGNSLAQLGLFLVGCSPGGGSSNMWTHLMGGSLDLSIMMTFISSVAAFGAVPLWVLMVGPYIMGDKAEFIIPYKDITILVLSLSIPCCVGLLIQRFLPRVSKVMKLMLTPLVIFSILFTFTFGVYANVYVFSLFDFTTVIAGFGLPALGFLSGLIFAKLLRLPGRDCTAICIETGIQNATVALFILKLTLEKPAGDLTIVYPAAAVLMTPIPLVLMAITRKIYLYSRRIKSHHIPHDSPENQIEGEKDDTRKHYDSTNTTVVNGANNFSSVGIDNPGLVVREEDV